MLLMRITTHPILKKVRACAGFSVVFLSLFVLFLYLEIATLEPHPSMIFRIAGAMADATLLSLPLLFLRGKWRYVAGIFPIAVGTLIFANVLYYRNFNDLIPASLYFNNHAGDSLVVNSAIQSLKLSDLIVAAFSILPLLWIITDREQLCAKNNRKRLLYIVLSLITVSWAISVAGTIRRGIKNNLSEKNDICEILFPSESTDWISIYNNMNFAAYTARVISKSGVEHLDLSEDDVSLIRHYLQEKSARHSVGQQKAATGNLIFIVVESLPSIVFERKDASIIAPYLYSLRADSASVFVDRCIVLANLGRSSDAQFIYNTGLLPLRNDILVTNYSANGYPSIAKALDVEAFEIIGEDKRMWSHARTSRSYGFSRLIDNAGSDGSRHTLDRDSAILNIAAREAIAAPQPFFMFVSTISMHAPYTFPAVTHTLEPEKIIATDTRDIEYLQRLHHFDTALNRFITDLKRHGLYDHTTIVITGDHEIQSTMVSEALHDNAVPLIILNSPISGEYTRTATQADVFPTIIDITGAHYRFMDVDYTGLGESIYRQQRGRAPQLPSSRDYDISEMLIRRK